MKVAARLYGDGLAGAGEPVAVAWHGDRLRITGEGLDWLAAPAAFGAGGFDADGLRIDLAAPTAAEGRQPSAAPHVLFLDRGARATLAAGAPAGSAAHFAGADRAARRLARNFRLGWAAVVAAVLLPLLLAGWLFARSDAIAAWVVERIPVEQEKALGDLVLAQTRASMRLRDEGPAVAAVRDIGSLLNRGSRHDYRWFVAERKELNAFAAPGGVVVVFSGLIAAAETPEELAGVLAHEIAHAELRHGLRAMVKSLGLRAVMAALLGDFGGGLIGDAATQLTELKFSRDAEREADTDGLRRLVEAGVDPQGMVRFFERLERESRATPPEFLSTHPASAERAEALAARIRALGTLRSQPLALDWPAIRASLPAAGSPAGAP